MTKREFFTSLYNKGLISAEKLEELLKCLSRKPTKKLLPEVKAELDEEYAYLREDEKREKWHSTGTGRGVYSTTKMKQNNNLSETGWYYGDDD